MIFRDLYAAESVSAFSILPIKINAKFPQIYIKINTLLTLYELTHHVKVFCLKTLEQ